MILKQILYECMYISTNFFGHLTSNVASHLPLFNKFLPHLKCQDVSHRCHSIQIGHLNGQRFMLHHSIKQKYSIKTMF